MIRKALTFIILAAAAAIGWAQSEGWSKYPVFKDDIDDVVETPARVYYLSGGNLFSFSPDDQESYSYSSLNKLSGSGIAWMRYNPAGKYLLLAYDDCNIDLVYDDGSVANLPDIRDAKIDGRKALNDAAFGEDRIVVAATFGIVVFNDAKLEVVESGMYRADILNVAVMDGRLLIFTKGEGGYYVFHSPMDARHNTLDKFKPIGSGAFVGSMAPLSATTLLMSDRNGGKLTTRDINFETSTWSGAADTGLTATGPLRMARDGWYAPTAEGLAIFANGAEPLHAKLPEPLQGQRVSYYADPSKVWAGDSQGLARYDVSGAAPTVLFDKMKPADATTCGVVGCMRWSPDGQRLYVSNIGCSTYKSFAKAEFADQYQTTNVIEDGFPRDVSAMKASADQPLSQQWQGLHGNARMYGDPSWIIEDPDDSSVYYCGNNHEGLYVLKLNSLTGQYEEIGKFDGSNSPVAETWGFRVQDVNIDPQGNLWMGYQGGAMYAVLPAAKRRQDPKTIAKSDWKEHAKIANFDINQKDMMSLFCKRSTMMFVFSGKDSGGLVAIDTKGTYDNPADDAVYHWTRFTDQDGNTFSAPTRVTFAIEDARGCVWIGTSAGVFEITNPSGATSQQMTVRRIKVPRNDGTNYADYLLDSDHINWIAIDPSDRKWIATENSGLFLVSETGDKIIRNYHSGNSPLLTNIVTTVECDHASNVVYVGTPEGLYTLLSDSAPAHDDFEEILAYPNPVRPDYYGDVTITGLMDNSIVKIADAQGNVVFQTRSEGGMATWDATGYGGSRVKSGVYYVYASSASGDSSSGKVAKIMVVN